jgi:hypothetical protein
MKTFTLKEIDLLILLMAAHTGNSYPMDIKTFVKMHFVPEHFHLKDIAFCGCI